MIGRALSHYRILEKVGAGGMGEVYRARDEKLGRDVAVKVLPAGLLGQQPARERFNKEALALSRLSHPHIATLLRDKSLTLAGGTPWMGLAPDGAPLILLDRSTSDLYALDWDAP